MVRFGAALPGVSVMGQSLVLKEHAVFELIGMEPDCPPSTVEPRSQVKAAISSKARA